MDYKTLTANELIELWKEKRTALAKGHGDSIEQMGELYRLRREIDRRKGNTPTAYVNFEEYVSD